MTPQERAEFVADVTAAIKAQDNCLSSDEQQWVKLAIAREAQSIKLRQAIIEKSLAGLVWAAFIGFGALVADFFRNHGFK